MDCSTLLANKVIGIVYSTSFNLEAPLSSPGHVEDTSLSSATPDNSKLAARVIFIDGLPKIAHSNSLSVPLETPNVLPEDPEVIKAKLTPKKFFGKENRGQAKAPYPLVNESS